jgi:2-hydroxy-3-keto-5-methylthiopentenyl-1-phosphate phosphatase
MQMSKVVRFAAIMNLMRPIIVFDFDGTLTETDIGRALCERYADPGWQGPIRQWLSGEISFPEAQQRIWKTITVSGTELLAHAMTIGQLRRGAEHLFEAARAGAVDLVLASGGFDLYIEPVLGDRIKELRHFFYNHLQFSDRGIDAVFPHGDLACKSCGVCKGKVIERYLAPGQRVLFCGDGSSDRCATTTAGEIFAVTGSDFAEYCRINDVKHTAFDDFGTVLSEALR